MLKVLSLATSISLSASVAFGNEAEYTAPETLRASFRQGGAEFVVQYERTGQTANVAVLCNGKSWAQADDLAFPGRVVGMSLGGYEGCASFAEVTLYVLKGKCEHDDAAHAQRYRLDFEPGRFLGVMTTSTDVDELNDASHCKW